MTNDLLGQVIGNCRIEALLGAGGMGQVFRARHVHLDRLQAIKIMHPHMASDPGFQARFRQEAQAIAALEHPHIVRIFNFDEQQGRYYIAMEYLPMGRCARCSIAARASEQNGRSTLGLIWSGRRQKRSISPMPAGLCIATSSRTTS